MVHGGVLQNRVAIEGFFEESFRHRGSAEEQSTYIKAHCRCGEQADRSEDAEPPADVVRDGQNVLIGDTLRLGHVAEFALRAGDRDDEFLQPVRLRAVVFGGFRPHGSIRCGGFQRAARFTNDNNTPTLFGKVGFHAGVFDQFEQVLQRVVIDVVAFKVDTGFAHPHLGREFVVVGVAQGIEERLRPKITAADPEDDDAVTVLFQPGREAVDFAEVTVLAFAAIVVEQLLG